MKTETYLYFRKLREYSEILWDVDGFRGLMNADCYKPKKVIRTSELKGTKITIKQNIQLPCGGDHSRHCQFRVSLQGSGSQFEL